MLMSCSLLHAQIIPHFRASRATPSRRHPLRHLDRDFEESVERVGRVLPLAAILQRLAAVDLVEPPRYAEVVLSLSHEYGTGSSHCAFHQNKAVPAFLTDAIKYVVPLLPIALLRMRHRTRIYLSAADEHGKIRAMKSHRATGRPRGRPSIIPWDLGEQILCDLESRMDKTNNTVRPDWKGMARRLHVSRSTISREIASLRNSGFIESFSVPIRQGSDTMTILYRLKRLA